MKSSFAVLYLLAAVLAVNVVAPAAAVEKGKYARFEEDLDARDLNFRQLGKSACEKCKAWYDEDRKDTTWLAQLNREIPCPCASTPKLTIHVAKEKSKDWTFDEACARHGFPLCSKFHPGADGCLRSKKTTSTGARQQCCYSAEGELLGPDHSGAGTPDRASKFFKHQEVDVKPYELCCRQCKQTNYCDYYKQLRRGSNSHC